MKKITLLSLLFIVILCSELFSQTTATYDFTFQSTWNAVEHSSIPSGAHWSDLVGATHNTANEFVQLGENATLGIKNVAEFGDNTAFENEVSAAISNNNADQWLQQGFAPFAAISSATLVDIEVTEDFPLVTLVSMVAPSPDWFLAVNSLNLRNTENDGWLDTFTIDVFAYDAGTDDGVNYSSANSPISPVEVSMANGFPINGNKMGTLTITLKSVLSVETDDFANSLKLFPNPSNGLISITNRTGVAIKNISIYNILGNKVKTLFPKNNNRDEIDLRTLNSGIYLARIEGNNGQVKTQKLFIQ